MSAAAPTARAVALRIVVGLLLLMALWMIWSGYLKTLLVSFGILSCCTVMMLSWRMGNLDHVSGWQRYLLRLPGYWLWLGVEIVKANVQVARLILARRPAPSPRLVTLDAHELDELGQTVLGNSITLTPGTVTLQLSDGRLRVHCLTRASAVELAEGEMIRRVAALTDS